MFLNPKIKAEWQIFSSDFLNDTLFLRPIFFITVFSLTHYYFNNNSLDFSLTLYTA